MKGRMSSQLDILALEPFYGGARKAMLETIMRHSRHRWTLLKLPPRRMERRLAAAAHWFAEQLSRHWVGRVDLLFASEALNLADLFRLIPELSQKPSVIYFHDNQLPPVGARAESPVHLVNLATAGAASEIWFNSLYHLKNFLQKATSIVSMNKEMAGRNPLPQLARKAQLMAPPVDLSITRDLVGNAAIERDPRMVFIDTRDADVTFLNKAPLSLTRRGEKVNLVTVGPVDGLDQELARYPNPERDEETQIRALHQAGVIVSARPSAAADHHAVRGLHVGCWPIFPNSGVYPELLPRSMHGLCLYDGGQTDRLCQQLQNVWWTEQPADYREELTEILSHFDAIKACHAMDERLE